MHLKILVADDHPENRILLTRFFNQMGHQVIEAGNGEEAVDIFQSQSPDIVIMDVMMPVMDGFEATRNIKSICGEKWVPVVFLTALNQLDHFLKGLEIGGDDFISKPFNFAILSAKIRVLERTIEFQKQILEKTNVLRAMNAKSEHEMQLGKHVLDRLIDRAENQAEVKTWISPLDLFSGDIVLSAKSPTGALHVLHADSAGHGLSAALAIMPAIELFYAMSKKGFGVGVIAGELNRKIGTLMPKGYFMTGTLVSVDHLNGTVNVWNGGNPSAIFLDASGKILKTFESKHPPLGLLFDQEFSPVTETWYLEGCQDDCRLYLFSDGVVDAEGEGGRFGQGKIAEILCSSGPDERIEEIRAALENHISGHSRRDDISVAEINCSALDKFLGLPLSDKRTVGTYSRWSFDMTLSAEHLKKLDLTPMVMNIVNSLGVEMRYNSHLFLILSELINNAIDHGLLFLNSQEKHHPLGMESYFEKRALRLDRLQDGEIDIDIRNIMHENRNCLRIAVRDTGPGFDLAILQNLEKNEARHGRGIPLVRSLCLSLDFPGAGNEAIAYYDLDS